MASDFLQPEKSLIHRAWHNIPDFFAKKDTDSSHQRHELDQFIATTFSAGSAYYYVLDFFNLEKPMLVSPAIESILGLNHKTTTIQSIIDRGHPEDMPFAARAEETALSIIKHRIGIERVTDYKISYSGRLRVADGSYRLFNHQAIILATDDNGGVTKTLGIHTDISHLTTRNNYKLSLLNLHGQESFLNIDVFDEQDRPMATQSVFTKRELEVLDLLSAGRTSIDIASIMNISPNTVKNHRKNILKKADCKTTGQLISKCMNEGLI
ncbi:response regulator transcription factor [uncultured Microbulbifer sp.]|uniref:response regulator transcription factor n=1 Tax=uncultured Microbulbifer sp. TaxID=348147 RepID=UPI00263145EF|nr:helix-turn-helix transcriptional regulator [uncultured Microbulbifer sp.]